MAPNTEIEIGSAEIYFAKKLANNDKKVRDRALKKLKIWLNSKSSSETGLDEIELLKIWKGLFYCMWFSDKPLVQEELAENLSCIIHIFSPPSVTGVIFSKAFLVTMGREWLGIDRLRLDKFYMLIKMCIKETLVYLAQSQWNVELVTEASKVLSALLLNPKYPDGLKMYYAEYTIPQLVAVCAETTAPDENIVLSLLDPYLAVVAHSSSDAVTRTTRDEILEHLLSMDTCVQVDEKIKEILKIPYSKIADQLCKLGARKDVQTKNRKILFSYVDKYRKATETVNQTVTRKRKRKKKKAEKNVDTDDTESHTVKKKKNNVHSVSHENEKNEQSVENGVNLDKIKKKKKKINAALQEKEKNEENVENGVDFDKVKKKKKKKINVALQEKENIDDTNTNNGDIVDSEVISENDALVINDNEMIPKNIENKKIKSTKKSRKLKTKDVCDTVDQSTIDDTIGDTTVDQTTSDDTKGDTIDQTTIDDRKDGIVDQTTIDDTKGTEKTDLSEDQVFSETINTSKVKCTDKKRRKSEKLDSGIFSSDTSEEKIVQTEFQNSDFIESSIDEVKQKLTFSDSEALVTSITDEDVEVNFKSSTEVAVDSVKKKKKKKSLVCDEPQPMFVKTPPPNAFFRKALLKSEPAKKKKKSINPLSTPMSESSKRKIRIDLSQNSSVAHRDLLISPIVPFSPTRKPNKSVLKTPNTAKRAKAMDFF